jgi:hypothetical protein
MNALIPVWILGAPFVGLLILAFSFTGPSAMGGDVRTARGYRAGDRTDVI